MATPPRKLPGIALPRTPLAPRPAPRAEQPANPAAAAWAALRAHEARTTPGGQAPRAERATHEIPPAPDTRPAAPTPTRSPESAPADRTDPAATGGSALGGWGRRAVVRGGPAVVLGDGERVVLQGAVDHWGEVVSATGGADRGAAEDAVRAVYRAAGLAEPERVVWYDSPLAAAVAAAVAAGTCRPADLAATRLSVKVPGRPGRPVQERLWSGPWQAAKAEATAALGAAGWELAWNEGAARLWDPTRELTERIREAVHAGIDATDPSVRTPSAPTPSVRALAARGRREVADKVRATTHSALGGQFDGAWLAVFDGLRECHPEFAFPVLAELAEVARHVGWWWPYERVVLISERPTTMHRDDHSRLHNGDGPALTYADGFALHAWRGMPVPADFVGGLGPGGSRLTVRTILNEDNAELRRVMLEIYGYDRYLREVGAQPLDRDETGVLWEIEFDDDEPIVMVEVLNATPEPDGSVRTYWLRVPPHTRTAREGVAWTFGLSPHEYRPVRET